MIKMSKVNLKFSFYFVYFVHYKYTTSLAYWSEAWANSLKHIMQNSPLKLPESFYFNYKGGNFEINSTEAILFKSSYLISDANLYLIINMIQSNLYCFREVKVKEKSWENFAQEFWFFLN